MGRIRSLFLLSFAVLSVMPLVAQGPLVRFDRLSRAAGLSQVSIQAILQDRRGFLWFGTQDGLNRYDGHRFEVFRYDPTDRGSLADSTILSLYEDRQGLIWIFHTLPNLLSRFDPRTEQITRLTYASGGDGTFQARDLPSVPVWEDPRGRLWIGTHRGIARHEGGGRFSHLAPHGEERSQRSANRVFVLYEDRQERLWVGTQGGLCRWLPRAPQRPTFHCHRHNPGDPASLPAGAVTAVYQDQAGDLWVGTSGNLRRFDPRSGTFDDPLGLAIPVSTPTSFLTHPIQEDPEGFLWVASGLELVRVDPTRRTASSYPLGTSPDAGIVSFLIDGSGDLWAGIKRQGLFRLAADRQTLVHYRHDPSDPSSLPGDYISQLFAGRSGALWIGTRSSGLAVYSPLKHRFRRYAGLPSDPSTLSNNMILAIRITRDGSLWVGTMTAGVCRLDADRRRVVEQYTAAPGQKDDLGSTFVRAIHEDRAGRLWVGTLGGGLVSIDRAARRVTKRYGLRPGHPESLTGNRVVAIYEDRDGILWTAGEGGLNRVDPETGEVRRFVHDPEDPRSIGSSSTRCVRQTRDGHYWVGTSYGLSSLDAGTGTFTNYGRRLDRPGGLMGDNIMALHEADDATLWLATHGAGLARFDRYTGTFRHYTERDGLSSNALYSVVEDDHGYLWVSHNEGLSRFAPERKTFQNFDMEDGLQNNEFNGRSFFKAADGELFFGGIAGFNAFYPEEIRESAFEPTVLLRSIRHLDRQEQIFKVLPDTRAIELSWRDRLVSFEFATLDFVSPGRNRYAYRLEGFDQDWVDNGTRRRATYTNLDGGRYVFRVKGTNSDGVWSPRQAALAVRVLHPPWKTWWAYGLYLLSLGGAIFGLVRYKTAAKEAELVRQRLELEQQRQVAERLWQIDRMKDQFLAHTSHELRTPLNGIIGIAESLLDGAAGPLTRQTQTNLQMVAGSGRRLAHLVDDILDFAKLKNHQLRIRRQPVGMRETANIVLTLCRPLADTKGLSLINRIPRGLPPASGDEDRIHQVLHNLVGNAIKFTERGEVAIEASRDNGHLAVSVRDTGIGIAEEHLEKIFRSFEQADASDGRLFGGTGLGLTITRQLVELHGGGIQVRSTPREGSTFCFTLPVWEGNIPETPTGQAWNIQRLLTDSSEPVGPAPRADSEADRPTTSEDSLPSYGPYGRPRILIVDDEPVNLQVLRNILSLSDFRIREAADGPSCLEILDAGYRPELILLDVMMPRLTGFEVTRRIRGRFSGSELPIVLVTAKNQVRDLVEGLEAGANDYLTKPFSKHELLARIKTHLSLSRAHSLEVESRRKAEELEQARAIQLSLLPEAPPKVPFLEIATFVRTATEVGGDYYDFIPQTDGSLFAVTGDATGHGISAGMMVSMTKSALKALDVGSPHILLRQLNQVLRAVQPNRLKMALNIVHFAADRIALSSAGMPPAFLYRHHGAAVEELLLPGLPLGGLAAAEYDLKILEYAPGDAVVLYSDGLPELIGGDGHTLGYERIADTIRRHGDRGADQLLRALLDLGEQWSGTRTPKDDLTLVVVRRI